jgi:hypothetical protein
MKRLFLIPLLFLALSCKAQTTQPLPEVRGDYMVQSICEGTAILYSVTHKLFEVPATGKTETGETYLLRVGREYHLRLEIIGQKDKFHIKALVKAAHDSERQNRIDRAKSFKSPL